jgi:hypothetical protein
VVLVAQKKKREKSQQMCWKIIEVVQDQILSE